MTIFGPMSQGSANLIPRTTSYSALLLAWKANHTTCDIMMLSSDCKIIPAPASVFHDDPFVFNFHHPST